MYKNKVLAVCLLALLGFTAAQTLTPWKEIFTLDCNGGFHFFDSSFPVNINAAVINASVALGISKIREAVNCKCPIPSKLSENEFQRRFVPGVSAALNMARPNKNRLMDNQDSCPLSLFSRTMYDVDIFDFTLPNTCTLELWEAGKPCLMQYKLLEFDANIQLAVDHCPNSPIPYMSATCSGNGCANFMKPCTADSDCGDKFKCGPVYDIPYASFMSDLFDTLKDMYIFDSQDTYPGCYSTSNVADALSKLVLGFFTSTKSTKTFSDLRVCGFDATNTDHFANDFNTCNTTKTETTGRCDVSDEIAGATCPALITWDGKLSDATSATASERKTGSAFKQFTSGTGAGTSDVVSLMRYTCDGSINVFATEKYGFNFGFATKTFVDFAYSFLQATQSCRQGASLTTNQFRAMWEMWNLDFWGYLYTSPAQPKYTSRSTWSDIFFDASISRLIMPDTCNFDTFQKTGVCALKWDGLKSLMNVNVTIRGKARRCTDIPEGPPEMYIECEGSDCASIFRPSLCTADNQCPTNLLCKDLTEKSTLTKDNYNPLGLMLWGQPEIEPTPAPTTPAPAHSYGSSAEIISEGSAEPGHKSNCTNRGFDYIPATEKCASDLPSYYQMLRDYVSTLTGIPSKVSSGFAICTFDYDAVVDNGEDWAKNMVINDGADYRIKGMTSWTNAFSEPDSATGSNTGSNNSGSNTGSNNGSTGSNNGSTGSNNSGSNSGSATTSSINGNSGTPNSVTNSATHILPSIACVVLCVVLFMF